MSNIRLVALALSTACSLGANAAAQDVNVGTPLPRFALLKAGTHHYLRFMQVGEINTAADIWTREVRFETRGGEQLVHIHQRRDGVGPAPSTRLMDSWFDAGSLRPRTHEGVSERNGKRSVEGVAFAPDRITGLKDLAENIRKNLSVESLEPTYNFEADIEFLQTLPLAAGYEARINFYQPGSSEPPQRYTFKVADSQTIAGPAGPVDCWVVTTDYNQPGPITRFWFVKSTQLMVREESKMPDGKVLVKTLID